MKDLIGRMSSLLAVCVLPLTMSFAHAQDYPNRAIRVIVPTAPGGQPDITSRLIFQQVSQEFKHNVVVENITGAGGLPAIQALLRAPADGYTFMVGDASHWAIAPAVRRKLPYDPVADFAPVRQITTTSLIYVVAGSVPANTIQEWIALVKSKPGVYNYGSTGVGSIHHLVTEAFNTEADLKMVHVPYKGGGGEALPALLGGQIQMMLSSFASVAGHAKAGRLKILGVTTKERSSFAPEIPPLADSIAGFDFPGGAGVIARSGTPQVLIDRMAAAMDRAINLPAVSGVLKQRGIDYIAVSSPRAFGEVIRSDVPKYARMAKITGVVLD